MYGVDRLGNTIPKTCVGKPAAEKACCFLCKDMLPPGGQKDLGQKKTKLSIGVQLRESETGKQNFFPFKVCFKIS